MVVAAALGLLVSIDRDNMGVSKRSVSLTRKKG
jgi:hypothetical protein